MKDKNLCPDCKTGILSLRYDPNGDVWVESCTDCKETRIHKNRRMIATPIPFNERRNK